MNRFERFLADRRLIRFSYNFEIDFLIILSVATQNKRTMNKKDYMKPAMRVVKIQHTGMLMTSGTSVLGAGRNDYGEAIEEEWD